jgi:hypothetical protein
VFLICKVCKTKNDCGKFDIVNGIVSAQQVEQRLQNRYCG